MPPATPICVGVHILLHHNYITYVTADIISYMYISLDSYETHDTDLCVLVHIYVHTHHLPTLAKYHHMLL